ncbi:CigR [Pseudomonas saudimassiliensis]|uniref:CigR n=1 Tax=Pseudomonas saudimassiliensis TaxID=1461581 RepID=A0A078M7B4_9PSED|nr:RcnB family protein [Pseudomonas saudimassiliensis]CEA01242.1 CigR [Pseudomonas saudimassiliensis]CEF25448.1 CigR [Pseudomonas saudimassiliensis]
MKLRHLFVSICAAAALLGSLAQAAPGPFAPGKSQDHRRSFQHHQQQRDHHRDQMLRRDHNRHGQQHPGSGYRPRDHALPPGHRQIYQQRHQYRAPDRDQLRRQIYQQRHNMGRGPGRPPRSHLIIGRPIPHGWSQRVPHQHVRHLPQYPGYEWHRAGSDLVLVAVTTGLIYTVVENVLN